MKEKIRVLHIRSAIGNGGGPEKTILNSPRYIDGNRYEMAIIYLKKKVDPAFRIDKKAEEVGVQDFHVIEEGSHFDRRAMRELKDFIEKRNVNILHTHDYKTDWWGWLVRRHFPSLKLVTTVHGWTVMNTRKERIFYQLGKLPLYFFDRIIAVNREIVDALGRIGVPAGKMVEIRNAIETQVFDRESPASGKSDGLVVGYIGRLSREKRVEDLIRAMGQLGANGGIRKLLIAGEGPSRESLQELTIELELQDKIEFLGYTDSRSFFNRVDIFVNPSLKEGLPNTMLEAMSMRSAVVATAVGGVGELLVHGETGLVIPTENPEAICGALKLLAENCSKRVKMVENARESICREYDFMARMKKIEDIYSAVVDNSS